jgi:hypothetical protein
MHTYYYVLCKSHTDHTDFIKNCVPDHSRALFAEKNQYDRQFLILIFILIHHFHTDFHTDFALIVPKPLDGHTDFQYNKYITH